MQVSFDMLMRCSGVNDQMRKRCVLPFLAVSLLFFSILNLGWVRALPANGVLYVPYSENMPAIDGKWTAATEWTDAVETRAEASNGWAFYLRLKHNGTHLFVLLDVVSDKTESTHDFGGIFFDAKDDGGSLPREDDYGFVMSLGYPDFTTLFQGTGIGNTTGQAWAPVVGHPYNDLYKGGFSGTNNPYETDRHRILEFAISRQRFNSELHYGFYAFISDRHSAGTFPDIVSTLVEWPIGAGGTTIKYEVYAVDVPPPPDQWGDLIFYEDINRLSANYAELQNNYTELDNSYKQLLASNNSLQSKLDQLEAEHDSLNSTFSELNQRFGDLEMTYTNTKHLSYALLASTIALGTLAIYWRHARKKGPPPDG